MQVTESELREALAARDRLPAAQRVESVRPAFTQDTLRLASESRFAAAKYAGEFARSAVFLEKPLAVIASHAGNIDDSSTAPGNTWVKFIVEDGGLHDAGIDRVDSLTFWYFWWNETASTTVVDVSAFTTISGRWKARADIGSKHVQGNPNDPDYDPAASEPVYGHAHLGLSANLAVYQYWTDGLAPIQNLPDQQTRINFVDVSVQAGGPPSYSQPSLRSSFMFDAFELKQRLLVIPPDGRIFAEVSFNVAHRVSTGYAAADFSTGEGNQVTSHWVEIEYVVAPAGLPTTPVVGPNRLP
jgi:hypothetical protein